MIITLDIPDSMNREKFLKEAEEAFLKGLKTRQFKNAKNFTFQIIWSSKDNDNVGYFLINEYNEARVYIGDQADLARFHAYLGSIVTNGVNSVVSTENFRMYEA